MKDWSYFSIRISSYLLKKIYRYWRKLCLCSDTIISEKNADAPFRLGNIERGVLSVLAKLLFSRLDCIRKLLFTARSQFFHTYTFVIISDSLIPSTWREIIKTATRAEINNNCIILASCETEYRAPATVFADYSVYFVCLHARDNSRPLSSSLFLPGAQLSSCNLLHFSPTNRIAERLVYMHACMHACKNTSRTLAAIPCIPVPIKDATRERPRPIYRRMKDDVQGSSKVLAVPYISMMYDESAI